MIEESRTALNTLLDNLKQVKPISGGVHTSPEARLFMLALCMMTKAETILETGYDAGYTTMALVLSGGRVYGVDDSSQYAESKPLAHDLLDNIDNCILLDKEALKYLKFCQPDYFDFIFVDDHHEIEHVRAECRLIKRVLKPGGLVAFHDTYIHGIWKNVLVDVFGDWQKINLDCFNQYNENFGLGLVRKPREEDKDDRSSNPGQ